MEGEREEERTSNVGPLGRSIAGFRRGTRPATMRRRHRAVPRGTNRSGVLTPVRRAGGRRLPTARGGGAGAGEGAPSVQAMGRGGAVRGGAAAQGKEEGRATATEETTGNVLVVHLHEKKRKKHHST